MAHFILASTATWAWGKAANITLTDEETALLEKTADSLRLNVIRFLEKYDLHMSAERYVSDDGTPQKDSEYIRQ